MSKSILYIGGFELPDKNAAAQRVIANGKLLREVGFDVSYIGISKDIDNAPDIVNGFYSKPVPYPTNTTEWMHHIFTFLDTKTILKQNPDYVILYNFPAIASLRILRACHKNGIRVIHDLTEWESSDSWTPSGIMRKIDIYLRMHYCTKKMDGVIAISRYLYDYYARYTKTILIPPTIDLSDAKFNRSRQLVVNSPIRLVYAGSIGRGNKDRLDYIIDSVVNKKRLELTIVGLTAEQYESAYGPLPINCDNIFFKGRVTHQEAVRIVCDSDFQMLIRDNSLKNKAGFPTKFVESMSCCTPVIATETSNICDYLIDGVNGYIVGENNSISRVLDKISNLESGKIITMKEKCREFAGFDYRCFKSEFIELFK